MSGQGVIVSFRAWRSVRAAQRAGVPVFLALALAVCGCREEGESVTTRPTTQPASQPITKTASIGLLTVTMTADRDRAPAGEPVRLTIQVETEAGVSVGVPKIEGIIGDFEVTQTQARQPTCGQYMQCAAWDYTLVSVIPGTATIPPLPFFYEDARPKGDGTSTPHREELQSEAILITIDGALADVKGALSTPVPFEYRILWWALGTLGFVCLAAWAARRWSRRSRGPRAVRTAPPEPAHVWALRELDRLNAEKLVERGEIQTYYFRVNLLLRQYIERRFGLMAGEQTSEEFVESLRGAAVLDASQKSTLERFVASCDPVKYAKQVPSHEDVAWVSACARDFIVQTAASGDSNAATAAVGQERAA